MGLSVDQILEETKRWPEEQVAVLFERFLLSNYRLPAPELDAEWTAEIKRRIDDIDSGREAGIPAEDTLSRVRKIVGL